MPMVNIYVFKEPRQWKNRAAVVIPFSFTNPPELDARLLTEISGDGVYHVTAFDTYGKLICELFKSQKTNGKNYGSENRKQN